MICDIQHYYDAIHQNAISSIVAQRFHRVCRSESAPPPPAPPAPPAPLSGCFIIIATLLAPASASALAYRILPARFSRQFTTHARCSAPQCLSGSWLVLILIRIGAHISVCNHARNATVMNEYAVCCTSFISSSSFSSSFSKHAIRNITHMHTTISSSNRILHENFSDGF